MLSTVAMNLALFFTLILHTVACQAIHRCEIPHRARVMGMCNSDKSRCMSMYKSLPPRDALAKEPMKDSSPVLSIPSMKYFDGFRNGSFPCALRLAGFQACICSLLVPPRSMPCLPFAPRSGPATGIAHVANTRARRTNPCSCAGADVSVHAQTCTSRHMYLHMYLYMEKAVQGASNSARSRRPGEHR